MTGARTLLFMQHADDFGGGRNRMVGRSSKAWSCHQVVVAGVTGSINHSVARVGAGASRGRGAAGV